MVLPVGVCPDGVRPLPAPLGGGGGTEGRPGQEEQHGDAEVPGLHCQPQVPDVPPGARGEDGEVRGRERKRVGRRKRRGQRVEEEEEEEDVQEDEEKEWVEKEK